MIKMYFDGAIKFNPDRKKGKIAFSYLIKDEERILFSGSGFCEEGTVPQAEYMGLLLGLKKAEEEGIKSFEVFGDNQLVCYQISGRYGVYNELLKPFYNEAKRLMKDNKIQWIKREFNSEADEIAGKRLQEELSK